MRQTSLQKRDCKGVTTVIHITDCHLFKSKNKQGYAGIAPFHSLEQVLQHAVKTVITQQKGTGALLLLVTGDISGDDSMESYQHFLMLMKQYVDAHDITWSVIPGNHDNNVHFNNVLGHKHLKSDAPLQLANWVIHGTDTRAVENKKSATGDVKQDDMAALADHIDSKAHLYHAVAVHHHCAPSHSWMDKHLLRGADAITTLLSQHSQIKAVLHGHVHAPLRYALGAHDTPVYGCPSTCWQWAMQEEFSVTNEAPGYQLIHLGDDGSVNAEVRRIQT